MRKVRTYFLPFLVIALVLALTCTAFQLGTKQYVHSRVEAEVGTHLEKLKPGTLGVGQLYDQYVFDIEPEHEFYIRIQGEGFGLGDNLVPVEMLVVGNSMHSSVMSIYGEYSRIINYCRNNREMLQEDTCRQVESNGKEYYVMARECLLQGESYTVILMASPDLLLEFIGNINLIFTVVMLALGIVLFFCSYQMGRAAEKSREKLTRYFQNASHELKTPIMSIQGYAEGLETGVVQDTRKAARIILAESDRMNTLVGDILFLSKMDARFASSAREKVDIRELLCDLLRGMEESAAQRNIRTCITGVEEPVFVMGNEAQLEMAIGNILSNALRFARDEIRVEITPEKKLVRVDIFNDGQEISQEDMPHIFERFYKGANGGHGIGLAIAKEVIQAHKGKIAVRNENGVCFTIRLKRAR